MLRRSFPLTVIGSRSDPLGRYVVVSSLLNGRACSYVCIYVPPQLHSLTFRDLGKVLLEIPPGTLIIGGDCNALLNREVDSSMGASNRTPTADKNFAAWTASLGLCDIWRIWNPQTRQYTHTSAAHHTHSRIDYFLMPATDVHVTTGSRILPRGISDHSPVVLSIRGSDATNRPMWRLNAWHINNEGLVDRLKREIVHYFQTNIDSVDSSRVLWAAGKATIRGIAKAYIRKQERDKTQHIAELEAKILRLELRTGAGETGLIDRQLSIHRTNLIQIQLEEAKMHWWASTQRVYDRGDKNGKLLYWLAADSRPSQIIPYVLDRSGTPRYQTEDIAATFAEYYKTLYTAQPRSDREIERPMIMDLPLPCLSRIASQSLENPFTIEEIGKATRDMKTGKTPGPDGFPVEYFRTFGDELGEHLLSSFEEAVEKAMFPPETNLATIVILLKPGLPPDRCSSYRPISLINSELKIFAKVLATRLLQVIPDLIHPDQCGFVPTRSTRHCIRRLHTAMAQVDGLQVPDAHRFRKGL